MKTQTFFLSQKPSILNRVSLTVLALFTCLNSSLSFAAVDENVVVVKKDPKMIYEDSSEYNRMNKQFYLGVEAGYAVTPAISSGLQAGYFVNRNNIVQFDGTEGTWPLIFFFGMKTKTLSLSWKHFYGNSFYTRTGLGYRRISVHDRETRSDSTYGLGREYGRSESTVADIAIGNQWQWDNFTMGCDWIGTMVPVVAMRSSYDSSGLSDSDRRELDDSWNRLSRTNSIQLLRFYIGASF